jgi:hypothetical protein
MTSPERADQEPDDVGAAHVVPKARQSLARVRRELSEEELTSPAVQRLLIDEIERLERALSDAVVFRDAYHDVDKRSAVLETKLHQSVAGEIVFGVCLTVGAAAAGYAPAVWAHQPTGWLALGFGGVLVIAGVISRVVQR